MDHLESRDTNFEKAEEVFDQLEDEAGIKVKFYSLAGEDFNDKLNRGFESFRIPSILEGNAVFRNFELQEDFVQSLVDWVNQKHILVIVGDSHEVSKVFLDQIICSNLALVTADGKSGIEHLDKHRYRNQVRHFGLQQQYRATGQLDDSFGSLCNLRLGQIRQSKQEIEPLLRETESCVFSFSAIRKSDAPGKTHPGISGLFSEEACQFCRYLGVSEYSKVLWINGFSADEMQLDSTVDLIGQMVWYFLEGVADRSGDYPLNRDGLTEYSISDKEELNNLVFYKSRKSGRWWFSFAKDFNPLELIPCSYVDYQQLLEGNITDRLLLAIGE